MKYAIIGNGVAGVEAALTIRKNDPSGEITIFTKSSRHHYYRPKLIELVGMDIPPEKLIIYKKEFYDSKKIEVKLSTEIVSIDTDRKTIKDSGGETYTYDKLLMTTGAFCFIPEIKGYPQKGIFSLRTMTDAENIRSFCGDKNNLAISGGGLLGLETAYSMLTKVKNVTVVEFSDYLLNRQLDETGGRFLEKLLEKSGLKFIFSDTIMEANGNGALKNLILKSGKEIPSDALIISAGVRADISLAKNSGLKTDRGIIIDDFMETSATDVYSAGDCIQHRNKSYGLWTVAKEQGAAAGMNMSGQRTMYEGSIPSAALKITGIDLFSAGDFNSKEGETFTKITTEEYIKFIYDGKKPISAIVIKNPEAVNMAKKVMSGKADPEEMINLTK